MLRTLYHRRRLCGSSTSSFGMNLPTGQNVSKPCNRTVVANEHHNVHARWPPDKEPERARTASHLCCAPRKALCLDRVLHVASRVVDREGLQGRELVSTSRAEETSEEGERRT